MTAPLSHASPLQVELQRAGVTKYSGWTEETTAEARTLYESGLSITESSEQMDRGRTTIGSHLRGAGFDMRPRG